MSKTRGTIASQSGPKEDESDLLQVHPPKQRLSGLTVADSLQGWETMGVGLEYGRGETLSPGGLARDDKRRAKATEKRDAIAKLRGQLIRKRLKVREKRVELRREQAKASQLDANYTKILSAFMGQGARTDPAPLYVAYEGCRKARDTVGPLEDDYNQLEDSLIDLEDALDERENKFYKDYPAISVGSNDSFSAASSLYVPTTASGSLAEGDEPVQNEKYLAKVGEANLMRERLEGLLLERAQYMEESRIRSPYGIPLEASSEIFLRDFDEIYAKALQDFHGLEDQVQELKRTSPIESTISTRSASDGEILPPLKGPTLSTKGNRRRLSELFPNSKPEYLGEFATRRARINAWLLHILQRSPLDADLHRTILRQTILGNDAMDDNKWAELLLKTWPLDDAAMGGPLSLDQSVVSDLPTSPSFIETSKTSRSQNTAEDDSRVAAMSSNSIVSMPFLRSTVTGTFLKGFDDSNSNNAHTIRVEPPKPSKMRVEKPKRRPSHIDVGRWRVAPPSCHTSLLTSSGLKTSRSSPL
ncbi:MAG: hypothetical protein M1812_001169 [Candelaria pacifica]|nr:MAG: hypothetical protein M1812_001169 [Candelaria pacifica]